MRVRRLEARRKADRIVTERYHRGGIEAETAIMCRPATPRNADFSRLGHLHHGPSENGGCDAVTKATEGSP